jgi:hemerythrin-like domain-containing protein
VEHARGLLNALSTPAEDARRAADAYAAEAQVFLDLLLQHLADEEELVIPSMLEHGERPLL